MTTNHHTAITTGAAANAATINSPLSQLDTKITSQETAILLRSKVWSGKTTAPTANDDSADGYAIGDRWIDTTNDQEYVAVDVTVAAAVWRQTTKITAVSTLIDGLTMTWNSGTSVTVSIGSCYAEDGSFIDVTSALVKSSLSLTPDTWYHVYVYLSGGTPTAEVVTTAPVVWKGTAYRKTGDTTRRYIGSVRAGAGGNVLAFGMVGKQVIYAEDEQTIIRVLTGGSATTETDVSLATRIPVTSQMAFLTLANGSSTQVLYTGASGNDNVAPPTTGIVTVAANVAKTVWHLTDASQNISYAMSAGGGGVNINCLGYLFER
jgi:hypothetical protein